MEKCNKNCGNCKYGVYEDADGWLFCQILGHEVHCNSRCEEDHFQEKEYSSADDDEECESPYDDDSAYDRDRDLGLYD